VAAVIRDDLGRLLLQEKSSGEASSLPAGSIELGESPQEALLREVLEETGFTASIERTIGVFGGNSFRYSYPNVNQVEYVVALFLCQIIGGSGRQSDAETRSLRYFEHAALPDLALPYPLDALFDVLIRDAPERMHMCYKWRLYCFPGP
jgi:8-oxo-dGTP pyrophosphatase MutT (NUDIX family)